MKNESPEKVKGKFRRITRLGFAIRKILAIQVLIGVEYLIVTSNESIAYLGQLGTIEEWIRKEI